MRIDYRICENGNGQNGENGIEIVRCYGADGQIVLPEVIQGLPVVCVAPYAFSARKQEEECDVLSCYMGSSVSEDAQMHLLAGEVVESVVFPDTVSVIGNYIFYGCRNLKRLEFSDRLTQIGSGAFTGCSGIRELKVQQLDGKQSCVKEILGELWQRIDVTFLYREPDGDRIAKVVFPEHYEEAVENTPARILFTQHHGSGNRYRQCFYRKELDYRKYDELFGVAASQDGVEVVAELVLKRLLYPVELGERYREAYEKYLADHLDEVAEYLIRREEMDGLRYLSRRELWSETELKKAADYAAREKRPEILSLLMDEKNRLFPQGSRRIRKYEL